MQVQSPQERKFIGDTRNNEHMNITKIGLEKSKKKKTRNGPKSAICRSYEWRWFFL